MTEADRVCVLNVDRRFPRTVHTIILIIIPHAIEYTHALRNLNGQVPSGECLNDHILLKVPTCSVYLLYITVCNTCKIFWGVPLHLTKFKMYTWDIYVVLFCSSFYKTDTGMFFHVFCNNNYVGSSD